MGWGAVKWSWQVSAFSYQLSAVSFQLFEQTKPISQKWCVLNVVDGIFWAADSRQCGNWLSFRVLLKTKDRIGFAS
jgi:hypothetical protein